MAIPDQQNSALCSRHYTYDWSLAVTNAPQTTGWVPDNLNA